MYHRIGGSIALISFNKYRIRLWQINEVIKQTTKVAIPPTKTKAKDEEDDLSWKTAGE